MQKKEENLKNKYLCKFNYKSKNSKKFKIKFTKKKLVKLLLITLLIKILEYVFYKKM